MTAQIKVKVQRKAIVKFKVLPRIPAFLVAGSGIVIDKAGITYTISINPVFSPSFPLPPYNVGDMFYAFDTTTIQSLHDVATGNVLLSGGLATAPAYGKVSSAHVSGVTGTGNFVLAAGPTMTTPTLGVAAATSINKVAITAPASSATLTIADSKTLTASNTLTLTGTDGVSVAFGGGGTVAYTGNNLSVFAATTSAQLAGVISDETGTGALVFADSPVHTTKITTPMVVGGTGAASTLTLESTSGTGTSDSIQFKTGSQVLRGTIASGGAVSFGPTAPNANVPFDVNQNTSNLGAFPLVAPLSTYPVMRLAAPNGIITSLEMNAYGAAVGTHIAGCVAGGTQAVPTATAINKYMFNMVGYGYEATNGWAGGGSIQVHTSEAWTATAHGAQIDFSVVPIGTTAQVIGLRAMPSGGISVGVTTDPGSGAILANTSIKATTYLQCGSFTVAGLPAGVTGATVFCSNCRMFNGAGVQEGAAAGTGGLVTYNGTAWKIAGTNVTAVA